MEKHIPVLLHESVKILNIKKNGIYVDCTLGRGGHTTAILEKIGTKGLVFGFDQDITAIDYVKANIHDSRLFLIHDNFLNIEANLIIKGIKKVDGFLYDLGVSSPQLDDAERGFSYRFNAELDMRMDRLNNQLTAKKVVNELDENLLATIFWEYGEEKFSRKIAKKIIEVRNNKQINTTFELVEIIKAALPQKILKHKKHPAKKVFQALRIFVNKEFDVLEKSLKQAVKLLNENGIIVVITFHSLEEKIVKSFFKNITSIKKDPISNRLPFNVENNSDFIFLTKKPILPKRDELMDNNRSHSSKLWAIRKKEK